ncbi:hypothetical protein A3860_05880 [Niastella vici]|uniref:Type I restriction modification DNA specificity domain-containing protein n=1 Tax=Niastella vici TaxID=1703345 RepID=A0A1V9FSC5_9BACT|nr:restriction endonuclease subunit S [Niastella vici]OQP61240.1 hypothetical protein A3860_05880 [Niastella vici]
MEGYKHTELGWIPDDWDCLELSHITQKERPVSYGIVQTGLPVKDGIKCIRVLDIVNGKIDDDNLITTSHKISNAYKRTVLQDGDLVMALRGKIGELAKATKSHEGYNLTRGVALVAPKANYDSEYLKQQMSSPLFRDYLMGHLNGSALKELAINVIRKIKVPIPKSKSEQLKIADVLSTWDKSIETLTQLIAAKQQLKKGLMQQLLTGKKRLPGFKGKWEVKKIKQLGKIESGGTPDTKIVEYWDGQIDWITPTDITGLNGYRFIEHTQRKITNAGLKNSSATLIPANSVIICTRATIGDCAINLKPITTNQGFKTIIPKDVNYMFLYYKMLSIKDVMIERANGSTFLEISKTDFENLEVLVPPTESEQTVIGSFLEKLDEEIDLLKKQHESLKLQKQGLMQQLLTGKKRVKV